MRKSEERRQRTDNGRLINGYGLISLVLCLLFITGCMVGPDFKAPEPNAPSQWASKIEKKAADTDAILLQWWKEFNDPNMTSLIERAMKSNLDLMQARERIRQARAASGVAGAAFWPTANATASAERNYSSTKTRTTSTSNTIPPVTITRDIINSSTSNTFKEGLDATWELDIFGGTRRNIEATKADLLASIEDRRNTMVTLTSEVAIDYIQLRGFQQEIIIARNNLAAQQESAEVVRKRFEGGFVSALDLANARAQVATTQSQIPTLETSAQQTIYSIGILLGQHPESLLEELSPPSSIPLTPPEIPAGLPSEMLRRRPDIRKAEAQIHSATAQIGVATADLFPKFNLTGSVGLSDVKPGFLTKTASFGPSVSWEIFNAGRVSYNIEVQKALQRQSVLTYKQTVLTALNDVESALIAYTNEHERHKALVDSVTENRKAVELSKTLYIEGQTEFLTVLDAQRSLYSSEDSLVQSTKNLSTNLVSLYKALGGGWDSNDIGG